MVFLQQISSPNSHFTAWINHNKGTVREEAHKTIVFDAYYSFRSETLGIKGSRRKEMMGDDILLMFRGPINAC